MVDLLQEKEIHLRTPLEELENDEIADSGPARTLADVPPTWPDDGEDPDMD